MVKGFAVFETAIGYCGVSWSEVGIAGLLLPDRDVAQLRARLERRTAGRELEPPPDVAHAITVVTALTNGEMIDLRTIALDMSGVPEFHRRVYDETRRIQPGDTSTYGEIARRLGVPGAARAVGQALGRNPFAIIVPCHRVLAAGGRMGGFTAPGGVSTKARLLAIEGAGPPLFRG